MQTLFTGYQIPLFDLRSIDRYRPTVSPYYKYLPFPDPLQLDQFRGYGCGLYFLYWKGNLVYIGASCDIANRLHWHRWQGKRFDAVRFLPGAEKLESLYIRTFRPRYNKYS